MSKRNATPIYIHIAVDVATRISKGEISLNEKISGRSTLAGEYNVSPETIRKAMSLLSETDIVEVKHGNGIHVSSIERAEEFIERYRIRACVNDLKEELLGLMKQRESIEDKMNETMNSIIDYTSRFENSEHVTVFEYFLDVGTEDFSQTLGNLDVWKHTGATIVGIRRNGKTILSPSMQEKIMKNDTLLYVGEASTGVRFVNYIRSLVEIT